MKNDLILDAISALDVELLASHLERKEKLRTRSKNKAKIRIARWSAVAACMVLSLCVFPIVRLIFESSGGGTPVSTATNGQKPEGEHPPTQNSAVLEYLCFEELLEKATDLMEGEFVRKTEKNGVYSYEFAVTNRLRGNETGEMVTVQSTPARCMVADSDLQFSTYDLPYKIGESYLLLLSRYSSVFTDGEEFSFVSDSLILPLKELKRTDSDRQELRLYGGKLADHLRSQEALSALDQGRLEEYILSKIQNNPLCYGEEYIPSTDPESVIRLSDYVLKVRVDSLFMESYTGDRITYTCTVDEVLKGSINKQVIKITFPIDKVEIGHHYVVALSELDGTSCEYFVVSSKNSIYDPW